MASDSQVPDTVHAAGGATAEPLGPVQPRERLVLLDVLRGAAGLVQLLSRDEFWTLFALLFGIGFAVQLERAATRNTGIVAPYLRRLLFLALIVSSARSNGCGGHSTIGRFSRCTAHRGRCSHDAPS